jgi:hypothetical protein
MWAICYSASDGLVARAKPSTTGGRLQWWISFSEIVRNFGLVAGGAIGIFLAWQRVRVANKQAETQIRQAALARRDHVAELFHRAVWQLKDEKLEVRLGAILTLG